MDVISGINRAELELKRTLKSGQCFRWESLKLREDVNTLGSQAGIDTTSRIQCILWGTICNESIVLEAWEKKSKDKEITIVTERDNAKQRIIEYLNLDLEYENLIHNMKLPEEDYGNKAYKELRGLRILKQDLDEVVISFIISQRNSITRIRKTIRDIGAICNTDKTVSYVYGTELSMNKFPSMKEIYDSKNKLWELRMGYREDYIIDLVNQVARGKKLYPTVEEAKQIETQELINILKRIRGIGDKVANCIALYGYNRYDAFPRDTWIDKVEQEEYGGHLDEKVYGKYAGIMQQYMFEYIRDHIV